LLRLNGSSLYELCAAFIRLRYMSPLLALEILVADLLQASK